MTQSTSHPLQYTYIVAFSELLLRFAGWSLKSVPGSSAAANTPLLNGRLAHASEVHYDREFPIGRLGTNLQAALDYTLFHESRPGVVIGRDGWLSTDEEFKPAPSGQQLEGNWALACGVQRGLNRRGVKLAPAVTPTKARLYPEHIDREQPAALHGSLYQDFLARARATDTNGPGLFGSLRQAKDNGTIFLRTDTHQSPLGAETVAQRLDAEIHETHLLDVPAQNFVIRVGEERTHKGDLLSFLSLDPLFDKPLPRPEQLQ